MNCKMTSDSDSAYSKTIQAICMAIFQHLLRLLPSTTHVVTHHGVRVGWGGLFWNEFLH